MTQGPPSAPNGIVKDMMKPKPLELQWTIIEKKFPEQVVAPFRAYPDSVGLDVSALILREDGTPHHAIVPPRGSRTIRTGLAMHPPAGHALLVCSRSGMAKDSSVFVTNSPGVVDPDYRGELLVLLYNGGAEPFFCRHGYRIAQLLVIPVPLIDLVQVDKLAPSLRGDNGFGSSGK